MQGVTGMKREYSLEDFKGVKKNPFYHKLNKEVLVPIRNEFIKSLWKKPSKMEKNPKKLCGVA